MFGWFKRKKIDIDATKAGSDLGAIISEAATAPVRTAEQVKIDLTEAYWSYLCGNNKAWNEAFDNANLLMGDIYESYEVRRHGRCYARCVLTNSMKDFFKAQAYVDCGIINTPIPKRRPMQLIGEIIGSEYIDFGFIAQRFVRYNEKELAIV